MGEEEAQPAPAKAQFKAAPPSIELARAMAEATNSADVEMKGFPGGAPNSHTNGPTHYDLCAAAAAQTQVQVKAPPAFVGTIPPKEEGAQPAPAKAQFKAPPPSIELARAMAEATNSADVEMKGFPGGAPNSHTNGPTHYDLCAAAAAQTQVQVKAPPAFVGTIPPKDEEAQPAPAKAQFKAPPPSIDLARAMAEATNSADVDR